MCVNKVLGFLWKEHAGDGSIMGGLYCVGISLGGWMGRDGILMAVLGFMEHLLSKKEG